MEKQQQSPSAVRGQGMLEWYEALISAALVLVLIFSFFFRIIQVDGRSMVPTLTHGDTLIVWAAGYTPQRGDVVIVDSYTVYGTPLVKRIIAKGGDTISIDYDAGTVTVNGELLQEDYIAAPTYLGDDVQFPFTVPEGTLFVMGDNRNESLDSRSSYVGCIDERDILGKATDVCFMFFTDLQGGKMNEMDTRFANQYNIQWFPGHMTKTLRMMEQEIQHVDASLVLLDARIPLSSLNPEIERITDRKPKLYALNKADLADPAVTEEWIRYFRAADAGCVAISAKQKGGANAVKVAIEKELSGLLERRQNRGMGGAKTQVMLCGIPNVGKSTFINTFAGSARAKAADRPGVTKGKQWVSTEKFDLLDMPGVLWKKFDSKTIASNLAFIGSIKDDILDVEELAMNLLDEVRRNYPDLVAQRYKLDAETLALPPYELLEAIGRKRGLLVRGGEVNTERCAIMLVDEFRACKWGRISLERPPQRDDLADFAEEDEE